MLSGGELTLGHHLPVTVGRQREGHPQRVGQRAGGDREGGALPGHQGPFLGHGLPDVATDERVQATFGFSGEARGQEDDVAQGARLARSRTAFLCSPRRALGRCAGLPCREA